MPKMKTSKTAAKRFKMTGTGKLRRLQQNRQHLFVGRSDGTALVAVVTLCPLEHLLTVLLRADCALYTSHSCVSFSSFSF